jgi:tripeptide aminopeptidase
MIHAIQDQARTLAAARAGLDPQQVIQDAVTIQQIPAPTFEEQRRAEFLRDRFAETGLQDVEIDEVYNVCGRWVGTDPDRPVVLVSAHTDTVFPLATDLTIRREGERIFGPGLGDNSLGAAGLLALAAMFQKFDIHPAADVWFVADSREEGLGDLGGMRAAWQRLAPRLGAAIVIEGMALGRIYHAGIAVRRLRIVCQAAGGHSWLHFGRPSAIHGLIELGARIVAITPPEQPRTTYNIGLIEGGHSVNSLATSAELYLDMRSETREGLAAFEEQVLNALDSLQGPGLDFSSEVVGDRPAGSIDTDHPLVQLAVAALETTGYKPVYETGSTDANILLANGLPAVTIGLSYGGNAHRLDEYIETGALADGLWQLLLLVTAAAEQVWHIPD